MSTLGLQETVVEAKSSVLSLLCYEGKFEVPWHQRYYDWTKENVTELLYDLDEAIQEGRNCYFLGAIVLVEKENGVWEINDGQQRLVTFSLICARLVRTFRNGVDAQRESLALRILFDLNEIHTKNHSEAHDLIPRLTPPRNDKTRYDSLIRGGNIGPNGKLTVAWDEINRHFLHMEINKAKAFFDFIIGNLEVACLYVPRELDPSSVFETLNARGKPLNDIDLIRNYFYSFFSAERSETRRNTVHEGLEGIRSQLTESKAAEYMRCFLQCKFGFLQRDRLYREMKARIKADCGGLLAQGAPDYVFELVKDCSQKGKVELFRSILAPSENDTLIVHFLQSAKINRSPYKRKCMSPRNLYVFLTELKGYKVTRPIVFALLNYYLREADHSKKKSIARLVHQRLELLTSFVMRTAFVATFQPSHFEGSFSALAQMITSAKSLNAVQFTRVLRECDRHGVLDDLSFTEQMSQSTVSERSTAKARRFLLGLAYHEQPGSIAVDESKYTVEHILPKSEEYLDDWQHFDHQGHLDYVSRIGNLALLSIAENSPRAADNRNFSRKKSIYENSAILLTREIASANDWSPDEIQSRQERLAGLASKVWRLPEVQ